MKYPAYKYILFLLMFGRTLVAQPVSVRWGFDETGAGTSLDCIGSACIKNLDLPRHGVLLLGDTEGQALLASGLTAEAFRGKNWTLSLLFKQSPLSETGSDSETDSVLLKSDQLFITVRHGSDGGNAGMIFATVNTDQKKILFKPGMRVDDGVWHQLVLRADAEKNLIQVFLDGKLYADRNFEGTASLFAGKEARFTFGPALNAAIDDVQISNEVLDDTSVVSDFNYVVNGFYDLSSVQGIDHVQIWLLPGQPEQCKNYAQLFARHLMRRAPAVKVSIGAYNKPEPLSSNKLSIYVGVAGRNPESDGLLRANLGKLPRPADYWPEGYAVRLDAEGSGGEAWVAGADLRGVMYGLGCLLFHSEKIGPWVSWKPLEEQSSPRTEVRSVSTPLQYSMDAGLAKKIGGRSWQKEEGLFVWEEQLLLGGNAFLNGGGRGAPVDLNLYDESCGTHGVSLDRVEMCRKYGVIFARAQAVNGLGKNSVQTGWNAVTVSGAVDPHMVCPSIPEARAAIVRSWEIFAKESGCSNMIAIVCSGDPGRCYCDTCRHKNWSEEYYRLSCDIADAIHKSLPTAKFYFSNQEMSFEENKELFELMRADEDSPLAGYFYGPGGSENSTYGYVVKNPKWERYPGLYPDSTYLKSRLQYLRPDQDILAFPDITHWKRAECSLSYIDPIISEIYPRRTYNARPRAYYKFMQDRMGYCSGVTAYSEGNFDDFNKFFVLRLLWNPDLTAEEIAEEYYTYYCGPDAGPLLAKAVFLGEEIREQPFMTAGEKIQKYRDLVQAAGEVMPEEYQQDNWRYWLMIIRSMVDSALYQRAEFQQKQFDQATQLLSKALSADNPRPILGQAINILSESPAGDISLESAREIDDEINRVVAIRSYALTQVEKQDSVGIHWLKAQIESIILEYEISSIHKRIQNVLGYNHVGSGEFYDNCGTIDQQSHYDFESGELYYGTGSWPQETRPSQRWYNYSFEAQDGLEFNYSGLDTNAEYTVTVTWPNPQNVSFALNSPNAFYIEADGVQVGQVNPSDRVERFSFDLPVSVTQDGFLNIALRKVPGQSRCTCISEIWVMKKR